MSSHMTQIHFMAFISDKERFDFLIKRHGEQSTILRKLLQRFLYHLELETSDPYKASVIDTINLIKKEPKDGTQ